MKYDTIPDALRERKQWVAWREEQRDGDSTKVPVNVATGGRARTDDAETWADFDSAVEYDKAHDTEGVGFVFTDDDPFVGVDLDEARDDHGFREWAETVIQKLDSWTEISVSGTGAHIYVQGEKPGTNCKTAVGDGELEMYDSGRFFALTGRHRGDTPTTVNERDDEVAELYAAHLADDEPERTVTSSTSGNSLDDEEVIEKAKNADNGEKFTRLWEGDETLWNGPDAKYPSQSEADQALCSHLAFWTGEDADQMDRLFRESGLMREKWDEQRYANGKTYGEGTIEEAIENNGEVYASSGWAHVRYLHRNSDIPTQQARDAAFRMIRREHDFATMEDTDELLYYEDGIYKHGGETIVKQELARNLDEHYHTKHEKQVIRRLKAMTYRPVDDFGPDAPQVCIENGVIDLEDFSHRDHSTDDLFLTKVPVEYDPEADCPEFDQFLDRVLKNDRDKALIYEMLGYCLWPGYELDNKFLILYGDGANGKSTLLNVFQEFLGDATTDWDIQDLAGNRFASADLHGSLANISGDMSSAKLTHTGTIKKLTGGDTVMAEKKNKDPFSFENRAKLIFAANQPPVIDDPSHAIARRVLLVEMPHTFTRRDDDNPDAEPAHELRQRLTTDEELSGILNKALDGLRRIKESGFSQQETPEELRKRYKRASDPVARFAQECLTNDTPDSVGKNDVHEAYNQWADATGAPTKSSSVFHRALRQNADVTTRQARPTVGNERRRVYEGLTFTDEGWEYAPTNMTIEEEHRSQFEVKDSSEL